MAEIIREVLLLIAFVVMGCVTAHWRFAYNPAGVMRPFVQNLNKARFEALMCLGRAFCRPENGTEKELECVVV